MNVVTRCSTVIVSLAAALTLSGCTFGPMPVATPSPESVATPTPTPTAKPAPVDPLTTITSIVVRPEYLELRDAADTIVSTLSYDADTPTFVSTLSTVFAAEPEQTDSSGGMEGAPSTEYWWGDGVRVWDDHEPDGWGPIDMNVSILFTAPVVGDGVTVSTSNGFAPGGDVQMLAADLGEPWYGNGYDQVRVESGAPIGEQNFDEYENAYSVAVNAWEAYGSSGAVLAPWNFGIGHV